MLSRSRMMAVVVVLALTSGTAYAQNNEDPLAPGARIRFSVLDAQASGSWASRRMVMKGTLTDVRSDSLVVQFGAGTGQVTMARTALADLAVSRGAQPGWRAHPKRTAISAVFLGAGISIFAFQASHQSSTNAHPSNLIPMGASVGLNACTTLRGAFGRTERWETVSR